MKPIRTRKTIPTAALLSALLTFSQATLATTTLWQAPIGERLRISAYFALPNGPYQAGHRGIDLPTTSGESVRSPSSGTVSFVGMVAQKPVLTIRVDERTLLSFEPIESALTSGQAVARGQPIGTVAVGGHCNNDCLHLGVRFDDQYVNPLRFLWPRPVLLPW